MRTSSPVMAAPPPDFRRRAERVLRDRFGLAAFRPGQLEVLAALDEHRAALALFPTGGGKSLLYQLYSQLGDGLTIVVSPLIALMKDQVDDMRSRGIAAARIDSSLTADESAAIRRDLRDGSLRLLYVAPERFNNEGFRALLEGVRVRLFAVDEAHCISQWGHNFRPDYLKLAGYARGVNAEAVLALTATATPSVVADIQAALEIPDEAAVLNSAYRPNLYIGIDPTAPEQRLDRLRALLNSRPPGTTIVYVTLQRTAEDVADALASDGLPARAYHAGLKAELRAEIQDAWSAGEREIVVATIAFGMGIDKPDVRYIYHYDLPKSLEGYVQEIGRAGRDGAPSTVTMLGSRHDLPTLAAFTLGDTPTEADLGAVVGHVLEGEPSFDVSRYHLSRRCDIRPLTLATVLTYLELDGVLRQGTPKYTAYRLELHGGEAALERFNEATQRYYRGLLAAGKPGRKYVNLDVGEAVAKTGSDRAQVARAIQHLERSGAASLKPSGLVFPYTRLRRPDPRELIRELHRRFETRERNDLQRLEGVVEFVEAPRCKSAYLQEYFGEPGADDCGHCDYCAQPYRDFSAGERARDVRPGDRLFGHALDDLRDLRQRHPDALGHPRKLARYLLGITSPATTAARITRYALFGSLAGVGHAEVLAWCEGP